MNGQSFPAIDLAAGAKNIQRLRRGKGQAFRDIQKSFGFVKQRAICKRLHSQSPLPALDSSLRDQMAAWSKRG